MNQQNRKFTHYLLLNKSHKLAKKKIHLKLYSSLLADRGILGRGEARRMGSGMIKV